MGMKGTMEHKYRFKSRVPSNIGPCEYCLSVFNRHVLMSSPIQCDTPTELPQNSTAPFHTPIMTGMVACPTRIPRMCTPMRWRKMRTTGTKTIIAGLQEVAIELFDESSLSSNLDALEDPTG